MMFVLTFMLVAVLETAVANDKDNKENEGPVPERIEEPDMCVGCDDKKEKASDPDKSSDMTVEVRVDPKTGKVLYIIKGVKIE